jgi:DNA processing protein
VTAVADFTGSADLAALSLLPLWCRRHVAERLRSGQPVSEILDSFIIRQWPDAPGEGAELRARAAAALAAATAADITPLGFDSPAYPIALTTIVDPPPVLWTRGALDVLNRPAVAIVGARAASPYALSVAGRLAFDLAAAGLVVVSGLARGVDSAAHRGALAARGTTIAVLGSGVDVVYPREHAPLAGEIAACGAVVSELAPGVAPLPQFFPQRNRIISGLARAVVVIEAGEQSGSLITARLALEQGRDVLAVPGNVLSGRNRGAHGLLRDGAKIVESADDIFEELGMAPAGSTAVRTVVDPILRCLTPGEPSDLDAISERTGLSPTRLLPRLFELELHGFVVRLGGGRFVRR